MVKNGYLTKVTFQSSTSTQLRSQDKFPKAPLDNLDVRIGFHHAMNFDLVLERIFRGDFVRMNTVADGFGERSNPNLKAAGSQSKLWKVLPEQVIRKEEKKESS